MRRFIARTPRIASGPTERRQTNGRMPRSKASAGRARPRDVAQSDQHLPLPVRAEALVVAERRVDRVRDHAPAALGSQLEIDAIAEAVLARNLQVFLEGLDEPRDRRAGGRRRASSVDGLVEEEQIDVGREVELRAAELAEREQRGRRVLRSRARRPRARPRDSGRRAATARARLCSNGRPTRSRAAMRSRPLYLAMRIAVQSGSIGRVVGRARRIARELLAPVRVAQQQARQEVARAEQSRQRRQLRQIERASARRAVAAARAPRDTAPP